jgi:hypothetical protein
MSFEANQGQTDARVKFLSRGSGYTLFLTQEGAVLSLHGTNANGTLRMRLVGANRRAAIAGADGLPGKSNYFIGNDPKKWRTNVPTYGAVKYSGVYLGIDLVYHGNQRLLEYDFVVAPGADPNVIDLRFDGARKLTVNADGALVIAMGDDEVIEHAPVVYQEVGGERKTLTGKYVLRGSEGVGFSVGEYHRGFPLIIDPSLVYYQYLGGLTNQDQGLGVAVDSFGNSYVTGSTLSTDFPTTPGAAQPSFGGRAPNLVYGGDAFVSKISAAGIIYSTYLGGNGGDAGNSIAVDSAGNAYVTGVTYSFNFPTTPGAFMPSSQGGYSNAFLTKVNATGSALIYSTLLGQYGYTTGNGIAPDASGNAYVTGSTSDFGYDPHFPTTPGAFQTTYKSAWGMAFVTKFNATGSALVYSTCLGGTASDGGSSLVVDASGNAYVTGVTSSYNFPVTPGAFQTTQQGGYDVLVTKLNATGSALIYSTHLRR